MKRKTIISGLLSVFAISTYVAQPTLVEKVEAKPDKVVIPYEKWKLPNGLTILLAEDHSDPVVHTLVTYKVGSDREDLGKSGFAHFFEHMMFQGSLHVADEEHFKMVSTAGGNMNGNTTQDRTVYFETLPSNYVEMALWLEADRMGFLLDSLTTKKFENQRDAVKNEKSQRIENVPYVMAYVEEIGKVLYPDGHPYSWPAIGYVDDLNRATLDDVKNFFLRWYGPNNAILTLAGDFNSAEVLPMIDKYFGTLKPCPEVKKLRPAPFTIPTDKYVATKDRTYFPLNLRSYPTVPQYHRDEPALDILGSMMGSGNNSIFYKNFVKSEVAVQAQVNHGSKELAGEFSIAIIAYPPDDFNLEKLFTDLDNKVKSTIDEFEKTGITDEALARVKAEIESNQYGALASVAGKASQISEWERLLGKSSTISDEIDRYNKVTKEDVLRVFNKYIKGAGAAVLNTYPIINPKDSVKSTNPHAHDKFNPNPEYAGLKYAQNPDKFNRAIRPVPAPAKVVKSPDYFQTKLKNGLSIIGTKSSETPEITIVMNMEGGSMVLPADQLKKLGVAELTAGLLNEGTKAHTTEEMSAMLEKLGSSIYFDASTSQTTIRISTLKKNLDATLKILEEKLLSPGFREEDFKLAKKQTKEGIKNQGTSADALAERAFNQALYGSSVLGMEPTVKSVDAIQLQDIKDYYNNYYSPSVTNLVIVGDIDEKDIMPKLEFLNKWAAKEVKIQPIPEAAPSKEPQFYVCNKTAAPSSIMIMGYPSLKYDATGDFYKNRIANFIFGGAFNSRLNLNLREDKGYTYGIGSAFTGSKYMGEFRITSSVKRPATILSLIEITKEFNKYQTQGMTDAELEFTKSSLLNQEALKYESPYAKANFLNNIVTYNLEKDYTTKQNQILKNMTRDEMNAHIKKYFDISKMTTVIVGDKNYIETKLSDASKNPQTKDALNNVKLKKIAVD
ncbi:MAG: M16 family metallopeptidase [Bacteroidia bacterium]